MKAVFFDFGRVLGKFDKKKACITFSTQSRFSPDKIHDLLVGSDLEKKLESGQLSGDEFAREIMQRSECAMSADDARLAWGNIFSPNHDIEPYIERLIEQGMKIGVLSNTSEVHWPYIAELPVMKKLAAYGAPLILSHEARMMKPYPTIYMFAATNLEVNPSDALFIDDIEENLVGARNVGMKAEKYDCTQDPASRLDEIFGAHGLL